MYIPSIEKTAELVQEIRTASSEQSSGTEQINKAIQQLDHVTQQNVLVSEAMASAAVELATQAEQLRSTMTFFRIAENASEPLDAVSHTTKPGQNEMSSESTIHQQASTNTEKHEEHKDKPSPDHIVDINKSEESKVEKDEQDTEFERY